jgi:hypothetical protein
MRFPTLRPRRGRTKTRAFGLTLALRLAIYNADMWFVPQLLLALLGTATVLAQAPDFRLTDVGSLSPRRGKIVSPRDYIMQVSGYYFGAAT